MGKFKHNAGQVNVITKVRLFKVFLKVEVKM